MKKLLIILMVFIVGYAQAQTDLVWQLHTDTYDNGQGDTITQELLIFIPIVDRTFTDTKFLVREYRNGLQRFSEIITDHKQLDSLFTNQYGANTYKDWLMTFMTINVSMLRQYGEEVWKINVDPTGEMIRWD